MKKGSSLKLTDPDVRKAAVLDSLDQGLNVLPVWPDDHNCSFGLAVEVSKQTEVFSVENLPFEELRLEEEQGHRLDSKLVKEDAF